MLSGQLVSLLGSSVVQFTIVWWVTIETGDPVYLSIAAFLSSLPMVIIGPIAGVYIDRFNRKLILIISDSLQALVTFWIILLFLFNAAAVWPVILINSVRGIFQAFQVPSVRAIIPSMVPKKHLSRMNAVNYLFSGLISAVGPFLGASFLAMFKIQEILWADIITFFIALVPLIIIHIPNVSIGEKATSFSKDFKLGIKTLKKVPALLTLLIHISIINFLGVPFFTLLTLYVKSVNSGTAINYAYVNILIYIGMIGGSLVATIKSSWKHRVGTILFAILIASGGYLTAALAPIGFFLIIGIGGLIRAGMIPIINTNFLTIIQTNVEKEKQGRIMAIVMAISSAVSPIGMIISGPLAKFIGIKELYIWCAISQMISVFIVWFFTNVKKVRYED
ncbi:MAG: MFS transporter [Candidatus Lokiarchaeota archaeon]